MPAALWLAFAGAFGAQAGASALSIQLFDKKALAAGIAAGVAAHGAGSSASDAEKDQVFDCEHVVTGERRRGHRSRGGRLRGLSGRRALL